MKEKISSLNVLYNIIGLLVLFFFGYWIYNKYIKDDFSGRATGISKPINVISIVTAQSWAKSLFDAMNRFGTDENTMDIMFDKISKIPGALRDVSYYFGVKRYNSNSGVFSDWNFIFGSEIDLMGWIRGEESGARLLRWERLAEREGL